MDKLLSNILGYLFPAILGSIASIVGIGGGLNSMFGGSSNPSQGYGSYYQPSGQGSCGFPIAGPVRADGCRHAESSGNGRSGAYGVPTAVPWDQLQPVPASSWAGWSAKRPARAERDADRSESPRNRRSDPEHGHGPAAGFVQQELATDERPDEQRRGVARSWE